MFTFKVKAVTHVFQKGQLLWWLQMGSVSNLLSEQVGEYLQTSWHLPYKLWLLQSSSEENNQIIASAG